MQTTASLTEASAPRDGQSLGLFAALGGLIATVGTALACVGPLVAILLGVGGFGWLTRYAYLRVPATLLTVALVGAGFYWAYRSLPANCARKVARSRRHARVLLWFTTLLATAVNAFEYLIFPQLG